MIHAHFKITRPCYEPNYELVMLRGAERIVIWEDTKDQMSFRVGQSLTPEMVDYWCMNRDHDCVITSV